MSKHDTRNALAEPNMPLSGLKHGPYRMMSPELLHTSRSWLIMYMFKALARMVSDTCRNILDALHQRISVDAQRQSETDFTQGSVRNEK